MSKREPRTHVGTAGLRVSMWVTLNVLHPPSEYATMVIPASQRAGSAPR